MSERGRRRAATAEQCAEVRRLASEGVPIRAIAAEVFGDRRFRGRVERIVRLPAPCPAAPPPQGIPPATVSEGTVPVVRVALARYLARVACGDVQPTVSDMVKVLDLERRLEAFESLERMNALTRALGQPLDGDNG
jgi:hypothetical protein